MTFYFLVVNFKVSLINQLRVGENELLELNIEIEFYK